MECVIFQFQFPRINTWIKIEELGSIFYFSLHSCWQISCWLNWWRCFYNQCEVTRLCWGFCDVHHSFVHLFIHFLLIDIRNILSTSVCWVWRIQASLDRHLYISLLSWWSQKMCGVLAHMPALRVFLGVLFLLSECELEKVKSHALFSFHSHTPSTGTRVHSLNRQV